jgi:hypothetical protein
MSDQTSAEPRAPAELSPSQDQLSRWWVRAVIATLVIGFSVLILLTIKVHYDAPPHSRSDQLITCTRSPSPTVVSSRSTTEARASPMPVAVLRGRAALAV